MVWQPTLEATKPAATTASKNRIVCSPQNSHPLGASMWRGRSGGVCLLWSRIGGTIGIVEPFATTQPPPGASTSMRKLPSLRKPDPEVTQQPPDESLPGPTESTPPASGRFRISIKMMMMMTLVVAVAAAAFGGLRRGEDSRAFYVIFATAAPLVVLIVVGVAHQLTRRR